MNEPIISVSGLRGIVGESLDPLVAIRYATAFAVGLPPGPPVVARDGRATGTMLGDAVRSGLAAVGRPVLDAGIAATPTVGVLIRQQAAAGGIQVSASHNPPEFNGLKLFSAEGRVINAPQGLAVLERYRHGETAWVPAAHVGGATGLADTTSEHLAQVLATVDCSRIRDRQYRVLLDANHGAGSVLGRRLLEALGCQLVLLGETPDGRIEHPAEPTEEHLAGVLPQVVQAGARVGFCQDPDADRLAVIDETGRYLGEEYTLALCLDHVLRQRTGAVVTNCATSRMSADIARQHGVEFYLAPVGEANVTDVMLSTGAVFGGEGNGGPIDPRVGYVRDSFVGMALILDAMAARDLPVSALADALPRYAIRKTKCEVPGDRLAGVLEALQVRFPEAQVSRMDGLRLDWPGCWLLVRGSNTEPIVRVIAEAETRQVAEELCAAAGETIRLAVGLT